MGAHSVCLCLPPTSTFVLTQRDGGGGGVGFRCVELDVVIRPGRASSQSWNVDHETVWSPPHMAGPVTLGGLR